MFTIRPYRPDDYKQVWELYRQGNRATGTDAGNGPWNDDMRHIEKTYLNGYGAFLVGIIGDKIIAMGALRKTNGNRAELKRMRVDQAYLRQGFGQAILNSLESHAKELNYSELHLDTTFQQKKAQKAGYHVTYQEASKVEKPDLKNITDPKLFGNCDGRLGDDTA